ncbi:MAG: OmpA family protein [Bdellovibrionales bacterium]|nr:OmpA family protein [Bdellovibrionales bacterium]
MGVTRCVYKGIATPDLRFYGGLNWYLGPFGGSDEAVAPPPQEVAYKNDDSDGDGVFDESDRCPETQIGARVDQWGCELKEDELAGLAQDDDQDGVLNDVDECPETPFGSEVNVTGCSVTPVIADADEDSVADDYDLCPDTAPGVKVNSRGCNVKKIKKFDLGKLNFISGSDRLTKKSRLRFMKKIDKLYKLRNKIKKIYIEGHTDNVGPKAFNLQLSRRRAATIKRIISKQAKISRSKISAKGYGETRPIATNKTRKGRLINRRVDMNLIYR